VGKGELFKFQGLKPKRRTRLGEFTAIILLFGMNSVKIMFKICMHCVYSEFLLNSVYFAVFWLQRLAVNPCTARRLIVWAILGVFG